MLTLLEVLRRTTAYFEKSGVETPRLDAEWLVASALGLKRLDLYLQFERPMEERELEAIRPLVRRRAAREPLQYVLGEAEFHGLVLKADRRALIPRPETERLVELTIARTPPSPSRILDLGTGTGAILLALLARWPNAAGVAADRSEDALALARENAERVGLAGRATFVRSDWYGGLAGEEPFDLVVSNPPYLSGEEWSTAEPEVREHEPRDALAAENAGRADLETIVAGARSSLNPGALLALETGIGHHAELTAFARENGFAAVESVPDYHGRDRYLFLTVEQSPEIPRNP